MNVVEVLDITETVINQCDERKDKIMCCYCPHKNLCEYLEKRKRGNKK